jgi:hypothetical protein
MKHMHLVLLSAASFAFASQAAASPIAYEGRNPNITPGASPLYANVIDSRAQLTRPDKPKAASTDLTTSQLVERGVATGLATHALSILTGPGSGNGTIQFGDGRYAEYMTVGGIRTIRLFGVNGLLESEISFPI